MDMSLILSKLVVLVHLKEIQLLVRQASNLSFNYFIGRRSTTSTYTLR